MLAEYGGAKHELSFEVDGNQQTSEFWRTIFLDGKTPQGQQVLAAPINIMEMIKSRARRRYTGRPDRYVSA